jgi:hypothetical protein
MKLADVHKALSLGQKGFTLTGTSIEGNPDNSSQPILCDRKHTFNGECEYSIKVKGRWYHAAVLMIGGKEFGISVGHWANNGTCIKVGGEEVNYKGREFKVSKDQAQEWNEVKIIISKGKAKYFYNGKMIHEAEVSIAKSAKLQWGIAPYRQAIAFKDFSLKLK